MKKASRLMPAARQPRLVVHCQREHYDVYIGRPSKWGNPFVWQTPLPARLAHFQARDRSDAIEKYEAWIRTQAHLMAALPTLHGKILGCWCGDWPCHGDVLVKLTREPAKGGTGS